VESGVGVRATKDPFDKTFVPVAGSIHQHKFCVGEDIEDALGESKKLFCSPVHHTECDVLEDNVSCENVESPSKVPPVPKLKPTLSNFYAPAVLGMGRSVIQETGSKHRAGAGRLPKESAP
jgi:hypothetical protein